MEASGNPEFWNRAASTRRFTHPLDHARLARALPRDSIILDYGCGQGRLSAELIEHGYVNVLGVDSSPEMIRIATEQVPDAGFVANDGARLPCGDATIDAVLMLAVLTCITSDDEQKNLLREFKRVLRPGGLLMISDYPLQTDERNLARYAQYAPEFGTYGVFRVDGALMRHHSREWLESLLEDFRVDETVELDSTTMNGNPTRILQLWARN